MERLPRISIKSIMRFCPMTVEQHVDQPDQVPSIAAIARGDSAHHDQPPHPGVRGGS